MQGSRVLITGAGGGIGGHLAREFAARGARLALVDRDEEALKQLGAQISNAGGEAHRVPADLASPTGCDAAVAGATKALGGIDTLVNLAGLMSFAAYEEEEPEALVRLMQVNLTAPMLLTRSVLPHMLERDAGHIVNVGSIFGSIGFAYFTAYSASKFGLRGFSQALRRELADTGVDVTYVAPRAVRTPLNTDAITRMSEAVKMNVDEPEAVAKRIAAAVAARRRDVCLGFPESLFVRVNALLPRIVDIALAAQNRVARAFARGEK